MGSKRSSIYDSPLSRLSASIMTSPNQERTNTPTLASEISLALLHYFLHEGTFMPGPRVFTDLANIQHVRLT
jgi:hypothetical protein